MNTDQVVNDYEIKNMESDALIAIDALESIVHECQGQYVASVLNSVVAVASTYNVYQRTMD